VKNRKTSGTPKSSAQGRPERKRRIKGIRLEPVSLDKSVTIYTALLEAGTGVAQRHLPIPKKTLQPREKEVKINLSEEHPLFKGGCFEFVGFWGGGTPSLNIGVHSVINQETKKESKVYGASQNRGYTNKKNKTLREKQGLSGGRGPTQKKIQGRGQRAPVSV